ncbi:unnamed protein product [Alopecurus aequalis]
MEEKAAEKVAAPAAAAVAAVAGDLDVTYCSEHPYPPGAAAAAGMAVGSGICAFCLQEKLGMLVSSSKSSPFHPPPSSVTPTTPPSNRPASEPLQPSAASGMVPPHKAKTSSSSAATVASGLRRSKSVAPRPEEPTLSSGITSDSPRKKSFWSFLYPSSSSSRHRSSSSSSLDSGDSPASARRKSVSVSSATSASLGRRLEAIEEPESPGRRSEGSSSSFGRKVARSRSVGCGSRSFSGDFLERLSTGFGDCALRRVESHREPKPKGSALGHLGGARDARDGDDDYEYTQQHRIKCAGFFGAAPPPSSSYWLSAPSGGSGASAGTGSSTRVPGTKSHRSWAWALASPMRALRPTSSTSSKTIMSAHHNRSVGNNGNANMSTAGGSAVATS